MVKVNLLKPQPGQAKERIMFNLGVGGLQKTLFLLSLILFLSGIALMLYTYYQRKNLKQINSQYRQAEKIKEQLKAFTKEKDRLNRGINLLGGYLKREIIWSEKLNQMRNLIPAEAWLTRIFFEKKSSREQVASFNLNGGLLAKANMSPIGILSNFVDQLKSNKEFFTDFDNPVLSDLRTEMKDGVEIMVFSIEMPLRKEKVLSLDEPR